MLSPSSPDPFKKQQMFGSPCWEQNDMSGKRPLDEQWDAGLETDWSDKHVDETEVIVKLKGYTEHT